MNQQQRRQRGGAVRRGEQNQEAAEAANLNNGAENDHNGNDQAHRHDQDQGINNARMPVLFFGQFEEGRMHLARQERDLANRLKAAVLHDTENDMEPLSDFMYGQIAIVTLADRNLQNRDLGKVLERVHHIQSMREEYRILDTYQNGTKMIQRTFLELLPNFLLHFDYIAEKGAYLGVSNITRFDMSIFSDPEKVKVWLAGVWYGNHAHNPDFAAIRQGLLHMVECGGYDWKNQNMLHIKAFTEWCPLSAVYPQQLQNIRHFNASNFVHLLAAMAKKLLPRQTTDAFEYVRGSDYGNLDELFGVPTPEAAARRTVAKMQESLKRRYDNEASFSL